MFRLQRLEITGFKSFADHTELVFTGDGITAIVGPNGCGKSNVADAISWVLGEQRVKHLRGGEMKDVIFQGARNRPPSGMAEVVLHLVRDEMTAEEPDIDDIDSTLEEIDEHAGAVEEKLAPELGTPAPPAEASTSLEASSAQAAPAAHAEAATAPGTEVSSGAETAILSSAAETAPRASDDSASSVSDEQSVPANEANATADGEAAVAHEMSAKMKAHGKRHWRPRRLALEFAPGETVSVTRRLYRSGESEYLLNGRTCRLRDIQDLFSGTGLSGAHYAIIEQGRIGQILSAKPMDRRALVEEAAGITKFRVRQRAAEARLDAARSNLSRVSDIISEIERQVGSLRRQAAKARRYRILREELRELLRHVYTADERALTALLEELRGRLSEASEEVRALCAELLESEEAARRATAAAREREEELAIARQHAADAALQRDRREREHSYKAEQSAALEKRIIDITNEMETLRARLTGVEAESAEAAARETELRAASEETARLLEEVEAAYAARVAEADAAETRIETARAELLTHTAVTERLMEIGRQLEATLERLAMTAEGLAREGERARAAHAEGIAAAERLNAEIAAARARLAAMRAEREAAAQQIATARARVVAADAAHTQARDEAARARHRLDTLRDLDSQRALYSEAVQRLFSFNPAEDAPRDFHLIGTLADALRVAPEWERAVEGALGPYLQAVVVPTPDDALRAAAWLRAQDAGRATFLVAGLHGASEDDVSPFGFSSGAAVADHEEAENENESDARTASENRAADTTGEGRAELRVSQLLGAPRELLIVLNRTLAREMGARVAGSLEQALLASLAQGEMLVTADGEWVAGGQMLGAGGARASGEGAGLLAFKREVRELETRAFMLERDAEDAAEAAGQARARLSEMEDAVVLLNDSIGREEREHMAREMNAASLAQEIERAERHLRVVADDAARLAAERQEVEERLARATEEGAVAEAARQRAAQDVVEAAELLASARRAAEVENERLGAQRAAAAAAAERRRSAAAELRRMEAEAGDLRARLERHEVEINEAEARLAELRHALEEMEAGAGSVESERAAQEALVESAAARLAAARERADEMATELAELNRRAGVARDRRAELEVQQAEAVARLKYLHEACASELGQSLEDIARDSQPAEGFDLEASRARVEELRARVEGFGAVNMMALEELSEAEERFLFLSTQRQDITDGIASTEEALREIKRRSRERFRHAFAEINHNFGQLFVELFGGGRGEMSLIDETDMLESGIDIVAQPPGKRLQNVLLLSGGEKAMAALAFVLAIFRYRPSPFCLLDEVDAPLDEANVGRFASKIMEMAAETQFLVITHNKKTMEMGRALYGVTMEEAGISRLVSVKFE